MHLLNLFMCLCIGVGASVLASEELVVTPCKRTDVECVRKSARQYFENSARGRSDYNMKTVDPLIIPSYDEVLGYNTKIINHLKNVNITGLKNVALINFQMDAKNIQLKLNLDITITGDVVIEYKEEAKKFPGDFRTIGKAVVDTSYPYEMKNDESGVEHIIVGREETIVKVDEIPNVKLSDKLMKEVLDDPTISESRDKYLKNSASILKESLEKLIKEQVVPEIIHNIRESAKILPTSAFFTD